MARQKSISTIRKYKISYNLICMRITIGMVFGDRFGIFLWKKVRKKFFYSIFPFLDETHVNKECEHAFINTLVRGDVSSLTWFESPNQYFDAVTHKKPTHELCSVYYAAVNFRDVMLAYGRLPPDAIPGQVYKNFEKIQIF